MMRVEDGLTAIVNNRVCPLNVGRVYNVSSLRPRCVRMDLEGETLWNWQGRRRFVTLHLRSGEHHQQHF